MEGCAGGGRRVAYSMDEDGGLWADGVEVSDVGGWIDLRAPEGALGPGLPRLISVRVGLVADGAGGQALRIEEIQAGARYAAQASAWDESTRARIARALEAEVLRRIESAERDRPAQRDSGIVWVHWLTQQATAGAGA